MRRRLLLCGLLVLSVGCSRREQTVPKPEPSAAPTTAKRPVASSTMVLFPDPAIRDRFLLPQKPHLQWHPERTPKECVLLVDWPTGASLHIQLDAALCLDESIWPESSDKQPPKATP